MRFLTRYAQILVTGCIVGFTLTLLYSDSPALAQDETSINESDPQCVLLSTIQQTEILSDQEILLTLRSQSRLKLSLAGSCPQLQYQGRFSYGATAGQLCAGLDRIITRSGDTCLIEGFEQVEAPEAGTSE